MLSYSHLEQQIARQVTDFAAAVRPRLAGQGDPEAQLYGPLENMFDRVVRLLGLEPLVYSQTHLPEYRVKPDFGLRVGGSLVGYVEVKRPGKGADASEWSKGSRDYQQWNKLRLLPNVPTVIESGYPGYEATGWGAIFVPNGTPQPIIDKLNATITKVVTLPDAKKQFEEQGTEGASSTQAEMAKLLRDDYARLGDMAKRIGLKVN